MKRSLSFFFSVIVLCSCKVTGQVSKQAINDFLNDSAVRTGHVGISIYDPSTKKYIYNYNADKNFMPSSNVKLFTLYAGMKYLGDSLKGITYTENDSLLIITPTGDPTFLLSEFKSQRVFDFLNNVQRKIAFPFTDLNLFKESPLGKGWAWDDYAEDFMAERSLMPIYGNVVSYTRKRNRITQVPLIKQIDPFSDWAHGFRNKGNRFIFRDFFSNDILPEFELIEDSVKIPFITSDSLTLQLLSDTLHKKVSWYVDGDSYLQLSKAKKRFIYSRPTDSLFRPMMFNSDNFFAEQTLLMVSNERLGYMSDEAIIDTLLKTDLRDIPTIPRWVDGSGLSRYNLFSPKDLVYILEKIKAEFPWQRIKNILPTAGQGTLKGYYADATGSIYAKTGSMSNNVSLSGYMVTKKYKTLIFSVLVNNFTGRGSQGRRAIEQFLLRVRESN